MQKQTQSRRKLVEIEYTYIDENGRTITRLKPQKTVEEYRAHSGGLWADDSITEITEITETTGASDNESKI
jgi:hypothetical protein